ncbi:hypothetical protein GCM10007368_14440 [Isoptericola cucumis]|uniref:Uncharacterized protein n=1 Tax=Isoptericola cucumis TaxID=1776856 RepID=A0ABQ2B764_9MICO|nr:hypothetical protein GCM10007368_14440 [Isoptericola cucumis]
MIVVVVLPTPPFWLHIATMRAGPWDASGAGSAKSGSGRPTTSVRGSAGLSPPGPPKSGVPAAGPVAEAAVGEASLVVVCVMMSLPSPSLTSVTLPQRPTGSGRRAGRGAHPPAPAPPAQRSALGCAAAYTSRSVSGVTIV